MNDMFFRMIEGVVASREKVI